jgi:hypothetical protein
MRTKQQQKQEMLDVVKQSFGDIRLVKIFMDGVEPGLGDAFIEVFIEELEKLRTKAPAPNAAKAMLSQPMGGKTDKEIESTRANAIVALQERGYDVVNTLFTDEWYGREAEKSGEVVQRPLFFLAKSLEAMSRCHAVYFCKGWEKARGCRIEHQAAVEYGLEIIYEE